MMNAFGKITSDMIREIKMICCEEHVFEAPQDLERYAEDKTTGYHIPPELVVKVSSTQEVMEILKLCHKNNIPVTPRGTGTGVTGGALAVQGGLILSLENMNKIIDVDEENLMAVVQPGVILGDLKRVVSDRGLYYPPDPSSAETCSVGGNVAECAGGSSAVKYGVTKDYVCGIEVVYPNGDRSRLGGKIVKNVCGYDLIQLIIGSEGTLGIVTEITLRLLPLPQFSSEFLVLFSSHQDAAHAISAIIKQKIIPASLELLDEKCFDAVTAYLNLDVPFPKAASYVLVKLDGNNEELLENDKNKITTICKHHHAINVLGEKDGVSCEMLRNIRKDVRPALLALSPVKVSEDIVVPRSRVADYLKGVQHLSQTSCLDIFCYGHAGDGNLHVQVLKRNASDVYWKENIDAVIKEIFQMAVDLGGTITAEHGVGITKKKYLDLAIDPASLSIMKSIKSAVDPKGILNPGKIF